MGGAAVEIETISTWSKKHLGDGEGMEGVKERTGGLKGERDDGMEGGMCMGI